MHIKSKHLSLDELSASLKVLSHPARLSLIKLLTAKHQLSVQEAQAQLNLSQPDTSRHLILLKGKNILTSKKNGLYTYYSLNMKNPVTACLLQFLNNLYKAR